MKGDTVLLNGRPTRWGELSRSPEEVLGHDFIYVRLHAEGGRLLLAADSADIARQSFKALYGDLFLTKEVLSDEVAYLLRENRYVNGSAEVMLYLLPGSTFFPSEHQNYTPAELSFAPADQTPAPIATPPNTAPAPARLLSVSRQLLYPGFTLWHKAQSAVATRYECPFSQVPTSASLAAHNYAMRHAAAQGHDIAITCNLDGNVTGVGEYPLFAVFSRRIVTPTFNCRLADTPFRRLVLRSCQHEGLGLSEEPLPLDSLRNCDEIFYATPQGLVSVGRYGAKTYPGTLAKRIAGVMDSLTARL